MIRTTHRSGEHGETIQVELPNGDVITTVVDEAGRVLSSRYDHRSYDYNNDHCEETGPRRPGRPALNENMPDQYTDPKGYSKERARRIKQGTWNKGSRHFHSRLRDGRLTDE